jgi:hypothetical protein
MAKFLGTIEEVAANSWRAGGSLTVEKNRIFDTVCKPRLFTNAVAAEAWLGAWAKRHAAAEVAVSVIPLGAANPG